LLRWRPWPEGAEEPASRRHGRTGEKAAAEALRRKGYKILLRNVLCRHGELDLVCRDGETLVFVEVKARTRGAWQRPAAAVDRRKRRRLWQCARDYLRELKNPEVAWRFDVVEVWLEADRPVEVQIHPHAFGADLKLWGPIADPLKSET
jgi:putative endonuclease